MPARRPTLQDFSNKPFNPPRPADEAFIAKVHAEVAEARARAFVHLGRPDPLDIIEILLLGSLLPPEEEMRKMRRRRERTKSDKPQRRCKGCGCLMDEKTPGCLNCRVRHSVRAHNARKKRTSAPQESVVG